MNPPTTESQEAAASWNSASVNSAGTDSSGSTADWNKTPETNSTSAAAASANANVIEDGVVIGDGWTKHFDETHQTHYYAHPDRGSQWFDPRVNPTTPATTIPAQVPDYRAFNYHQVLLQQQQQQQQQQFLFHDPQMYQSPPVSESGASDTVIPLDPEEAAYFSRLPANAKRLSYASFSDSPSSSFRSNTPRTGNNNTPTNLSKLSSAITAPENDYDYPIQYQNPNNNLLTVANMSTVTTSNPTDEEIYEQNLPPNAKRLSYVPIPSTLGQSYHPVAATPQSQYEIGSNSRPGSTAYSYQPLKGSPAPVPPTPAGGLRKSSESNRKFCGCFRTRRGCCIVVWSFVLLFLAGLGLAWPRIPAVTVSAPYANGNVTNPTVITSGSVIAPTTSLPFSIQLNLAVNVTVTSPDYEGLLADTITFTGNVLNAAGTSVANSIVEGTVSNIYFPGKATTQFNVPFTVLYSASSTSAITSDGIVSLLESQCVESTGGDISIKYTVTIDLKLISWTGYKPSISGTTQFACPDVSAWSGLA
ncbi:hypothetical protein HK100_001865 [Physocladia obscura]|uniref:WW domain-containing protein n=1 Tax=Physocladia obscura TaxID=109957 RepID=A0AAD5SXC6_9FUNG|nr:hypothetical protein HK100_001865 [Physocladia obscura]